MYEDVSGHTTPIFPSERSLCCPGYLGAVEGRGAEADHSVSTEPLCGLDDVGEIRS
jgi:hypothetical protein